MLYVQEHVVEVKVKDLIAILVPLLAKYDLVICEKKCGWLGSMGVKMRLRCVATDA